MSDQAPMSDQQPLPGEQEPMAPVDQTAIVKEDVQALAIWAAGKAKFSQDGKEFNDWASGIQKLLLGIQPPQQPFGGGGGNGSAEKPAPKGKP